MFRLCNWSEKLCCFFWLLAIVVLLGCKSKTFLFSIENCSIIRVGYIYYLPIYLFMYNIFNLYIMLYMLHLLFILFPTYIILYIYSYCSFVLAHMNTIKIVCIKVKLTRRILYKSIRFGDMFITWNFA